MPPQMPACGTSKLRATSGHPRPSVSQPQCVRPLRPVAALATPRAAGSPSAARLTQAIPSLSRFADSLKSHGISSTADLESIHFDLHLADAQRTTQFLKDVVGIQDNSAIRDMLSFLGAEPAQLSPYRHAHAALLTVASGVNSSSQAPVGTSSRPPLSFTQRTSRGGLSAAPTRSKPALAPRATSSSHSSAVSTAASRYGSSATSTPTYAEEGSLEELAQYEIQVLDLLQNYSGLTLERLDGLMYMSGKEPKFTQGIARLQLLLDAMISQGTVSYDGGQYRFVRRTPNYERYARSNSPSSRGNGSSTSSYSGRSNGSRSNGGNGGGYGYSPRPASSRSPGRAPAPRPYAEPVDLSQFEGRLLDTLSKYDGLPLERLNNMLAMTPGEPRYEASPDQLEVYLRELSAQGKIINDRNIYKYNSFFSSRARSPSASRRPASPTARMADIDSYEPAVLDLLQNYANLDLERIDNLLTYSPKAAGYRSSPRLLSSLLDRLVDEGRVQEINGQFSYRPRSPTAARAKSPTASRGGSGGRRKSSGTPANARMMDIAFYEPAVLDLLQSYAGLTLERLDTLLSQSPKAPGYVRSPASLSGLLTKLQSQGRVMNENGIFRYRSSGKTPKLARGKSPTPSTSFSRATSPTPVGAVDAVRRALTQGLGRTSSPQPPVSEDWSVYENTITTMLGNYGALPLDRLHDMLKMSMVWPRYDRSPAQLSSYLASLVAAGRLVMDNGLYRLAGTQTPARMPSSPYTSTPASAARYEGQVLSTLAAYPGLTVERLTNMLRLSKTPASELTEDAVATLMTSLVSQGKVTLENGLYKVTASAGIPMPRSEPATSFVPSGSPLPSFPRDSGSLLERIGFPTQEGLTGYTPFVEIWNGRWAMVGMAASIPVELRTGSGTLEQLGFQGLPSMELFDILLWGSVALVGLSSLVTGVRYAANRMDPRERDRWDRLFGGQKQILEQSDRFDTPELQYLREAEIANARAAMMGFLASVLMEALTGRGIVGQAVLYLKLLGILGEDSGF